MDKQSVHSDSTTNPNLTINKLLDEPILFIESVWFDPAGPTIWNQANMQHANRSFKQLSTRAIFMAKESDTVIVDANVDRLLLEFFTDIGLKANISILANSDQNTLIDDIINDPKLHSIVTTWSSHIETYMPTKLNDKIRLNNSKSINLSPPEVVTMLNSKVVFDKILDDAGVNKIKTDLLSSRAAAYRILNSNQPLILKSPYSLGGSGIYFLDSKQNRELAMKILNRSLPTAFFILQESIKIKKTFNLQLYITDEESHIFSLSEEILDQDRKSHIGNLFFPAESESLLEEFEKIIEKLISEVILFGYKGLLGIDFILDSNNRLYPIEFNARHNSSTHAIWYINRLFNGNPLQFGPTERTAYLQVELGREVSVKEILKLLASDLFDLDQKRGIIIQESFGGKLPLIIIGDDKNDRDRLLARSQMLSTM
ncbi:MAG: ATP-grasp domain-containing protein, partial [Nitrospinota bacterium]